MLSLLPSQENETLTLFLLVCAVLRIYLEVVGFSFERLPLTQQMARQWGRAKAYQFHRMGFYLSVGYFLFAAPGYYAS